VKGLLRSKKKRLIKKQWKKTGMIPCVCNGKKDGLYWHTVKYLP